MGKLGTGEGEGGWRMMEIRGRGWNEKGGGMCGRGGGAN